MDANLYNFSAGLLTKLVNKLSLWARRKKRCNLSAGRENISVDSEDLRRAGSRDNISQTSGAKK